MFLISRTQNEATSNSTCLICFLTRHSCHEVFHGCPTQIQTTTMHTSLSTFAFPQQLILIFYIFKIFIIWLSTVILILQGQVQRRREFLGKKRQNLQAEEQQSKHLSQVLLPQEKCAQVRYGQIACPVAEKQHSRTLSPIALYTFIGTRRENSFVWSNGNFWSSSLLTFS